MLFLRDATDKYSDNCFNRGILMLNPTKFLFNSLMHILINCLLIEDII